MSDRDHDYWAAVRAREAAEAHDETPHGRVLAAHERHRRDERLRERHSQDSSACRKGTHRVCAVPEICGCSCHGLPESDEEPPATGAQVLRSGLSAVQRAEVAARKAAGEGTAALAREFGVSRRRIRQLAHEATLTPEERERRAWERREHDRAQRRALRLEARGTLAQEEALDAARGPDPEPPRPDTAGRRSRHLRMGERGAYECSGCAACEPAVKVYRAPDGGRTYVDPSRPVWVGADGVERAIDDRFDH